MMHTLILYVFETNSLYNRIRLIHHRLIRHIFISPVKIQTLTCIPVRLIRYCLIRHFAQFVTSLYPRETFCLAYFICH